MVRLLSALAVAVAIVGPASATPATDALDAAVAQVKSELASQSLTAAQLIAQLQARIAELEAGTTTPTPTPPPPDPVPVAPPPTTTTSWPLGWDDPRFASNVSSGPRTGLNSGQVVANVTIVESSGNPSVNGTRYTLRNSRIKSREGPRIAGSDTLIEGSYIEVSGTGTDHGDGIQCYTGGRFNIDNIVIRNTYVKMIPGMNNAGIFFADYCSADLTLENVKVDGDGSPNGAIWLPCNGADKGVRRLTARNVEVSNTNGRQLLEISPGSGSCVEIVEWTNVHKPDGTQVPRP